MLRVQIIDWVGVANLTIHFCPTHKFLLLGLSTCLVICQSTERLSRNANNISAASGATLVIWVNCCFVRLELVLVYNLMVLQVCLVLLLTILLTVISVALMLDRQFIEIFTLAVKSCESLICSRCCWLWANWWVLRVTWY